jgi:hypothetical protein
MKLPERRYRSWRWLLLLPVSMLGVLSLIATGGGGNSGNEFDDDDDQPVTLLPTYNFFLTNLVDGGLLTVVAGGEMTVAIDIDGLFAGSVEVSAFANTGADLDVTFVSYVARRTSRFDMIVSSIGESPLDGTITVLLTEDIGGWLAMGRPTSGAFDVMADGQTASVTVTAADVSISLNGGEATNYTWDEFISLLDDEQQEAWLRRASLAANAFEFMSELFFTVANELDQLESVTLSNPAVETCDMFTGTPPAGVLAQGEVTLTWLGSGELSDGDDFDWQFNQCWSDDPGDAVDDFVDGSIFLENYTETVDYNTNTLFEIGFGGLSGQPGGVIFDLTMAETVEEAGVITIPPESILDITGGFTMIIQSP